MRRCFATCVKPKDHQKHLPNMSIHILLSWNSGPTDARDFRQFTVEVIHHQQSVGYPEWNFVTYHTPGTRIRFYNVGYYQSCVRNSQGLCTCCYDQTVAAITCIGICSRGIEIASELWDYRECQTVYARDFAGRLSDMSIARIRGREYTVV